MNAGEEYVEHIEKMRVKCAVITIGSPYDENQIKLQLPMGYSVEQANSFLASLGTIEYDNGYGGQRLFGTIWYEDGTWSDRGEYDGSEWWNYNKCPDVPVELIQTNRAE